MSQNDFTLANQGFPSMRADMNSALQALASSSSSATEPSTTYANQFWYDTTTSVLKLRNEANSAWLPFWNQDVTTTASPTFAGLTTPSISATGGTIENVEIGASVPAKGTFTTLVSNNVSATGPLSNRNLIINGGMQVDQRNAGAAIVAISGDNSGFIVDRFDFENRNAGGTMTGQQSTIGNLTSAKMTATSAVTTLTGIDYFSGLFYKTEAQDVYHLNGKSVTFSFIAETNWSGNLAVNIRNGAKNRSYVVDAPVVSGVNNVSVSLTLEAGTVDAIDNGRGILLTIGFNNEGTLRTATTDDWIVGNKLVSTSSTQWAKTTGNFLNITSVQLEEGITATPFEQRSYADQLTKCQRYYQTSGEIRFMVLSRYSFSSGAALCWFKYELEMRAPPSMTTQGTWSSSSGFTGDITFNDATIQGVTVYSPANSAANANVYAYGGTIIMDAEL